MLLPSYNILTMIDGKTEQLVWMQFMENANHTGF